MSPVLRFRKATPVERWSLANAAVLLGAIGTAVFLGAAWPLVVIGTVMLAALTIISRREWTPDGSFGWANATTVGRLLALCALPLVPDRPDAIIGVGLAILLSDGLDGWLARRYDLASEFGEFFDKESDSLFLLVLCAMAAFRGTLPDVILGVGLLRYVFVITLFLIQPHVSKEYRSSLASVIYVVMVVAMLTSFLPYPAFYQPIVAVAAVALLWSFGRHFVWLLRLRRRSTVDA